MDTSGARDLLAGLAGVTLVAHAGHVEEKVTVALRDGRARAARQSLDLAEAHLLWVVMNTHLRLAGRVEVGLADAGFAAEGIEEPRDTGVARVGDFGEEDGLGRVVASA